MDQRREITFDNQRLTFDMLFAALPRSGGGVWMLGGRAPQPLAPKRGHGDCRLSSRSRPTLSALAFCSCRAQTAIGGCCSYTSQLWYGCLGLSTGFGEGGQDDPRPQAAGGNDRADPVRRLVGGSPCAGHATTDRASISSRSAIGIAPRSSRCNSGAKLLELTLVRFEQALEFGSERFAVAGVADGSLVAGYLGGGLFNELRQEITEIEKVIGGYL